MEHCTECDRAMPMTHWHYEEFDEVLAPSPMKVYASKPHPRPSMDAWEELLDSARRTKVEKPEPKPRVFESQYHENWHRLDDGDFICDACGAVSGDFDLFEEVGIENECHVPEPVVEAEPVEKSDTPETVSVKATASKEVMDMYKKMLDDITKAEKRAMRSYKMPAWPSTVTWTSSRSYSIDETVEKTLEEKSHKTYAELAKEFKAASEKPENQKKWYSEVHNEMQRRERRR